MALTNTDLLAVYREATSTVHKLTIDELKSFVDTGGSGEEPGNGEIKIKQSGRNDQSFTVNQSGKTTITVDGTNKFVPKSGGTFTGDLTVDTTLYAGKYDIDQLPNLF